MNGRMEQEEKINKYIDEKLENLPDFVKEWQLELMAKELTPKTRKTYLQKIMNYFSFLNLNTDNITLDCINKININKYLIAAKTIKKKGIIQEASFSNRNNSYIILNNFCNFLYESHYIDEKINIPKPIKRSDETKNKKELLREEDFSKILYTVMANDDLGYRLRDQAILSLFMTTGMRLGALQAMNVEDINFGTKEIIVIDKNHKTHIYKMSKKISSILDSWINYREKYVNTNTPALFINLKDIYAGKPTERMHERSIIKIVEKYTKKAFGKVMRPHQLRAGYCSILYQKTENIEFVRRAVGHSRVTTTQRYIIMDEDDTKTQAADLMESFL